MWCDNNQLTTLDSDTKIVGQMIWCVKNTISDLRGCPQFRSILPTGNPIEEILSLFFFNYKCVDLINGYDVIQGNNIIEDRLLEVFSDLNIVYYPKLKFKYYNLI